MYLYKCMICNRQFKNLLSLTSHIVQNKYHPNRKEYFNKFLGKIKYCTCGKETTFISLSKGYGKFCSTKCSANDKETRSKYKKTCLDRYGAENTFQNKDIKEKIKKTLLENYGVDNVSYSNEIKQKKIKTCLDRYGINSYFKTKEFKEKSKQTCLEKYGSEHPSKTKKFQDKIKKTNLDRYGVENVFQNKEIREKYKQTCLKRYGVEHTSQVEKFKEKNIKSKRKKWFDNLLNSSRLKDLVTPLFKLEDYIGTYKYEVGEIKYLWKCNKCETEFDSGINHGDIPRCPICYPPLTGTSIEEQEVLSFIQKYYPESKSDREILEGKEIDIYIEELKLGIEYNGLYWHSEIGGNKEPKYHQDKTLLAKSKGIHLIQIFEDEWLNKKDIVKSILLNKMGKSPNKIFARKCQIQKVENKEAKQFLFDNHLQGPINGIHIGLYYEEKLISLITMGKSRFNKKYDYEILRFCNKLNYSITGGLSKILSYFKKLNPNSSIITYADARYGEGKGYLNSGFVYKELTNPSYYYINNNQRENRIGYQKHKLKNLLESFDSTLTEWQNMQLNGFDRIWDCGNYSYIYKLNKGDVFGKISTTVIR